MLIRSLFDRPVPEFIDQLDQPVYCRFEDDLAFLCRGNRRISVNAHVTPSAPEVVEPDGVVPRTVRAQIRPHLVISFSCLVHLNPIAREVEVEGRFEFIGVCGNVGFAYLLECIPKEACVSGGETEGFPSPGLSGGQ